MSFSKRIFILPPSSHLPFAKALFVVTTIGSCQISIGSRWFCPTILPWVLSQGLWEVGAWGVETGGPGRPLDTYLALILVATTFPNTQGNIHIYRASRHSDNLVLEIISYVGLGKLLWVGSFLLFTRYSIASSFHPRANIEFLSTDFQSEVSLGRVGWQEAGMET